VYNDQHNRNTHPRGSRSPGAARSGGVPVTNVESVASSTISTLGNTGKRECVVYWYCICLSLSSPMNSTVRFASPCVVMAQSRYFSNDGNPWLTGAWAVSKDEKALSAQFGDAMGFDTVCVITALQITSPVHLQLVDLKIRRRIS